MLENTFFDVSPQALQPCDVVLYSPGCGLGGSGHPDGAHQVGLEEFVSSRRIFQNLAPRLFFSHQISVMKYQSRTLYACGTLVGMRLHDSPNSS